MRVVEDVRGLLLERTTRIEPVTFSMFITRDDTTWFLQRSDASEPDVTPRGSRRYSPRGQESLFEEGANAWRPERTEHRQQSRQLSQQRERGAWRRNDTRVSLAAWLERDGLQSSTLITGVTTNQKCNSVSMRLSLEATSEDIFCNTGNS